MSIMILSLRYLLSNILITSVVFSIISKGNVYKLSGVESRIVNSRVIVSLNGTWYGMCSAGKNVTDDYARIVCREHGHSDGAMLLNEEEVQTNAQFIRSDKLMSADNQTDGINGTSEDHVFIHLPLMNYLTDIYLCGDDICFNDTQVSETCSTKSENQGQLVVEDLHIACGDLKSCMTVYEYNISRTVCKLNGMDVKLCMNDNTTIYRTFMLPTQCYFTNYCIGPGSHYQVCGCPGVEISTVCHSFVCFGYPFYRPVAPYTSAICDGYRDCVDYQDEINCHEADFPIRCEPEDPEYQNGKIKAEYICDSDMDCLEGEDEMNCDHTVGIYCRVNGNKRWFDRSYICNNVTNCDNDRDELDCDFSKGIHCYNSNTGPENSTIWVNQYKLCEFPDMKFADGNCRNFIDQMNCTTNNVLVCTVDGYQNTRIRQAWVCNSSPYCDNMLDEQCIKFGKETIHKHRVCDGYPDVTDGSDEQNCELTNITCQRRFIGEQRKQLQIPVSWLCDGVEDCITGEDEDYSYWMVCGSGSKTRCYPKSHEDCNQGFKCPNDPTIVVQYSRLCNYDKDACGGYEKELCEMSRDMETRSLSHYLAVNNCLFVPPCIPGMVRHDSRCLQGEYKQLLHRYSQIPGTKKNILYLDSKIKCSSTFGLQYSLLNCLGKCEERQKPKCELVPSINASCTNDDMRFSLLRNRALTTYIEDKNKTYTWVFQCNNMKCISPDKVCNLVDDCEDGSDEGNCLNSFQCQSGAPRHIRFDQMCDGTHDCFDSSDECNEHCPKARIISDDILKVVALIIGSISTSVNIYVMGRWSQKRFKYEKRITLVNNTLITMIGMGDFCLGVYLLNIVLVDYLYSKTYCTQMFDWLTSFHCSFLGVLSTFGQQLSLFSMVVLSAYRLMSIKHLFYTNPYVTKSLVYRLILTCLLLITISLVIGLIPIIDATQDYFTNGVYYKYNTLFNKITKIKPHIDFINRYKEIYKNQTYKNQYSWREIRSILENEVFTKDYKGVAGKPLTFYGNDGVCSFKWFVNQHDPQRGFSISIITLNIVCFFIIVVCYGKILSETKASRKETSSVSDHKNMSKLQNKISLIILSDFLCWIPFCMICLLHATGMLDATPFYQISSIVLMPINSCINPIIYSDSTAAIWDCLTLSLCFRRCKKHNTKQSNLKDVISADSTYRSLNNGGSTVSRTTSSCSNPFKVVVHRPPNQPCVVKYKVVSRSDDCSERQKMVSI